MQSYAKLCEKFIKNKINPILQTYSVQNYVKKNEKVVFWCEKILVEKIKIYCPGWSTLDYLTVVNSLIVRERRERERVRESQSVREIACDVIERKEIIFYIILIFLFLFLVILIFL